MDKEINSTAKDPSVIALQLLARREHSRHELQNKLQQRGFAHDEIALILHALEAQNLLSDHRFAAGYVEKRSHEGYGPQRIQAELQQRGVSSDIIDACLAEDDDHWLYHARQQLNKKFSQPSDFQDNMKQKRYLQYRGFTFDQINKVFACYEDN